MNSGMMRILLAAALALACNLAPAAAQQQPPQAEPATVVAVPSAEMRAAAAGWGKGTWLDQHERCVATARAGGIDLVLLGDSITQGWGGPTRSVGTIATTKATAHFAGLRTANMGISGDRTQHVLWRVRNGAVDGLDPRWLVLTIGTNNLSAGDAPADIARGVAACVAELRARLPHAHLVVQAPHPRGATPDDAQRVRGRALTQLLAGLALPDNTSFLDPTPAFTAADGTLVAGLYAGDALHLQPAGYEAWGALLRAHLDQQEPKRQRHVVFVAGDEEYRSEESLPMLAALARRALGVRTTVCLPRAADGSVDPMRLDHVDNLRHLDSADLMVLYTRFRALPDDELRPIVDHAARGLPMVGFRTATHAFAYPSDGPHARMNADWPRTNFGQRWIAHHGHFDDGREPLTDVTVAEGAAAHPVLRGVEPGPAWSWLYHVDGGGDALHDVAEVLLTGTPRKSGLADTKRFPRVQPLAWTREPKRADGATQRVFFTTLGHPYDFREPWMRRLALQGIAWALGMEAAIPGAGLPADPVEPFEPPNSGVGGHRKP
ncbi:MAG: hypothetical protein RIT25_178 [Planctomycetota bacterium]